MNLFSSVQLAPKDPIFGLTEAYTADQRAGKVNLGVGVYYTDEGKVPLLRAVLEAEKEVVAKQSPRAYVPIEGPNPYNSAVQNLLFGADSPLIKEGRVVTAECLGGTGALRVGGDFVKRLNEPLTQPLEYLLYADSGFELSLIAQIRRGWYWELN